MTDIFSLHLHMYFIFLNTEFSSWYRHYYAVLGVISLNMLCIEAFTRNNLWVTSDN